MFTRRDGWRELLTAIRTMVTQYGYPALGSEEDESWLGARGWLPSGSIEEDILEMCDDYANSRAKIVGSEADWIKATTRLVQSAVLGGDRAELGAGNLQPDPNGVDPGRLEG